MEKIIIRKEDAGKRIDKFLASSFAKASADKEEFFSYSRGEIAKKIKNGEVMVDDKNIKPSHVLEDGDVITLENFSKDGSEKNLIGNSDVPLEILFEDENIIVINKQPGVQAHPSANEKTNTLANGLVARFPEITDVHDGSVGAELRPGIVHRLDKDTSGVMVIARNQRSFQELKKIFKDRNIEKNYIAVCQGIFDRDEGIIDKPLARAASYHKQVIARKNTKTTIREAVTEYKVSEKYGDYSLVEVFPKTGRMHQIRVHLASIGHPVVGDPVYGKNARDDAEKKVSRQLLHAKGLKFVLFGKKYAFSAPMPQDFEDFLAGL